VGGGGTGGGGVSAKDWRVVRGVAVLCRAGETVTAVADGSR
jgi:hypothetical protein